MSVWLQILDAVSAEDVREARRLLNFELPQALRWPEVKGTGEWRYVGPVAKVVRIFFATLTDADRGMAKSRTDDFIDYITDLIVSKVRRSVSLLEYTSAYPTFSLEEIAESFNGWDGLKLGPEKRITWVTKHLCSMSSLGLQIKSGAMSQALARETDDGVYGYHELALVTKWRVDRSWQDYKAREELDRSYVSVSVSDSEEEPSVADEVFDYGAIAAARVVLNLSPTTSTELSIDLNRMGDQLTSDFLDLVEQLHQAKPLDGYLPIAWHNVWWTMIRKYEAIPLTLNERDPHCDVDRTLAEYIGETYPAVLKPNRLNIFRRRSKFEDKCEQLAQSVLLAWNESGSESFDVHSE